MESKRHVNSYNIFIVTYYVRRYTENTRCFWKYAVKEVWSVSRQRELFQADYKAVFGEQIIVTIQIMEVQEWISKV